MLQAMKNSEMFNRAIFVARHYNGQHIGPNRFQGILDAAKSVVTINPFNEITGENQYLWLGKDNKPKTAPQSLQSAAVSSDNNHLVREPRQAELQSTSQTIDTAHHQNGAAAHPNGYSFNANLNPSEWPEPVQSAA